MIKASELLNDLQVETYSSMERKEKTDFILNQMRLLIEVARIKDEEYEKERKDVKGKDPLGGGESEWIKVRVASRKINEEFLKEKENEVRDFAYTRMIMY
jgi:26S proteasome regulatory subunit N5